jgi:hypothetical protein
VAVKKRGLTWMELSVANSFYLAAAFTWQRQGGSKSVGVGAGNRLRLGDWYYAADCAAIPPGSG